MNRLYTTYHLSSCSHPLIDHNDSCLLFGLEIVSFLQEDSKVIEGNIRIVQAYLGECTPPPPWNFFWA